MKTRIGIKLDDKRFRPDIDILDRYLAYSAELLRLALLGIAGYAFLLKEIVYAPNAGQAFATRLHSHSYILIAGVISLGLSSACALLHRIYATDSISCIIDHLRCRVLKDEDGAIAQRTELIFNLHRSDLLLKSSAYLLGLGAVAVAITFILVLSIGTGT